MKHATTARKSAASRQSARLGLSIVERVCESMNGQFLISGVPEGGTRAELIFTPSGDD